MNVSLRRAISLSLLATAGTLLAPDKAAMAAVVPDYCSAFMDGAVVNNKGAYCVSNFGWSDTWYSVGANESFPPFPSTYDRTTDLFSGDDSPNLAFSDVFGNRLSGTGWLSPIMDGGSLFPSYDTLSQWQIVSPLEYVDPTNTDTLRSTISYAVAGGTLDVTITTHLTATGELQQTFDITNNTGITLADVFFSDYFNFHPNGSDLAATQLGTTSFGGTQIDTFGDRNDPSYIGNGHMKLTQNNQTVTPDAHAVGTCTGPVNPGDPPCISIISDVESGNFNNANDTGQGDTVGVLGKSLGTSQFCNEPTPGPTPSPGTALLCQGDSVSITVVKTVPEPGSLALLLLGGPMLWWRSRRSAAARSTVSL
jgi:hypothetical protein